MKTQNIVLLGLIGAAIYYFYKKNQTTALVPGIMQQPEQLIEPELALYPTAYGGGGMQMSLPESVVPYNDLGLPAAVNERTGQAIEQTLDQNGKPINTAYQVRYAIKGIPNII